ncbi:DUF4304 domain-containing protein [Microbacterium maritypicum]|uniref:DUF4304 domain-containing protein n=1 Tax=Microbacterium maritypicum TaxID=33918 RepID=UPI003CEABFD1
MPHVTAQSRYDELLTGFVAPALRKHGWRGSRGRFTRRSEDISEKIEFQKSRASSAQTVLFRINRYRTCNATNEPIPQDDAPIEDRWLMISVADDFDPEPVVEQVLEGLRGLAALTSADEPGGAE